MIIENIHPYDMAVLIEAINAPVALTIRYVEIIELNGKFYNQTVDVPVKTDKIV